MKESISTGLEKLEKGNSYIVSFENSLTVPKELSHITIIDKLENSILIEKDNKKVWYYLNTNIQLFDHVPVNFTRKHKLIKLNEKNNKYNK